MIVEQVGYERLVRVYARRAPEYVVRILVIGEVKRLGDINMYDSLVCTVDGSRWGITKGNELAYGNLMHVTWFADEATARAAWAMGYEVPT